MGRILAIGAGLAMLAVATLGHAQIAPSAAEVAGYGGLHAAAAAGDAGGIARLIAAGTALEARDGQGRTALHVAAHGGHAEAVRRLLAGGSEATAMEHQRYDAITIAAVRGDAAMIRDLLAAVGDASAVTSPYEGTAQIAAAHLGHVAVVATLIAAGAPLDHVNNLGWTALIEAIVLGDGGARHTEIVRLLLAARADPNLADRGGTRPLALALARGYRTIISLLEAADARP